MAEGWPGFGAAECRELCLKEAQQSISYYRRPHACAKSSALLGRPTVPCRLSLLGVRHPHMTAQFRYRSANFFRQQDMEEGITLLLPMLVEGLQQEGATQQVSICTDCVS